MQILVDGNKQSIPPIIIGKLEMQYDELLGFLKEQELTLDEWILSCQGDKAEIATSLRTLQLHFLSTGFGVAYLFTKVPCPMGH